MFKKLFRPKWENPRSAVRIDAIRGFDEADASHQQLLTRLATQDSEPAVRREAAARLRDLELLASIQRRDLEAPVREVAIERSLQLLAGKSPLSPELPERLARVRTLQSPQMLAALIRDGDPVEIKQAAVEQLSDELYLEEIALRSPIARLRVAAAEKLTLPEILRQVEKETKGHDKAVWRIVHDRLGQLHADHKEREAEERRREEIVEAIEAHARSAMAPLYRPRRDALLEQWRAVAEHATPAQAERFETALMLCEQRIEEQAAIERADAERAEAAAELQATIDAFEQVRSELQTTADYDRPSLAAVLRTQRLRWEAASTTSAPTTALQQGYLALATELDALLTALDRIDDRAADLTAALVADDAARWQALTADIAWPADFPRPTVLSQGPSGTTAPAIPAAKTTTVDFRAALAELERAIEAGQLRDVQAQLRRARDIVRAAGASHDAAWHALEARAKELIDWASYAVLPRKEALVADMNALAANPAGDPEAQADKVRALREAWKALGQVGQAEEQALRDRFEAAAEQAYAPCRAHFAALAEQRQENLRRRQALCEALAQTLAQTEASWQDLEAALKHTRQAWSEAAPVDRDQAKPVQERFDGLNRAVEARIAERDGQISLAKTDLIARAEALRSASDARAACDEAKQLQAAWKSLGSARPATERPLWKRFRSACDALFAVREQQYQERRQARESVLAEADGLLAALTALAQDEATAPESLRQQLAELDRQFGALRLPKPVLQERRDQWRRQLTTVRRSLDERGGRRQDQAFAALAAQLASLAIGESPELGPDELPWMPALRARLNRDQALSADARQQAAETEADAKAQACLWLEILSDTPTPAAYSGPRMQLQMDRLARRGSDAAGPRDALVAWQDYARLHAPAAVCQVLDQRALACLRRLFADRRF